MSVFCIITPKPCIQVHACSRFSLPDGSVLNLFDPRKTQNGLTWNPEPIWEFPKIRVPYLGILIKKDPAIQSTILGSPTFGNSHM